MTIKEMRTALHLTQSEFGDLFGIPMRTIQEWERGRRTPPAYIPRMMEEILVKRGLLHESA